MKSTRLKSVNAIASTVFFLLAIQIPLAAQDHHDDHHRNHHYKLIDLSTFGGAQSYVIGPLGAQVLNNHGAIAGWADTSTLDPYPGFCFNRDCLVSHAFQRQEGVLIDLGTLPGGSSSQAVWIASNKLIVGNSQNGETDPLIPGRPETRAVLWNGGQINDLGTFGGNESIAAAVNNRGQVVGSALNTTADPFSLIDFLLFFPPSSSGTQARAFLWQDGEKQDLGTLGTGNDALAFFVNEAGQVAGFAYTNSTPNSTTGFPTFHPFLWKRGKGMQDLGTLGGTIAQAVNGLNERGQVVGATTTLVGDVTGQHLAFLWDGKQLIDLGTLGGDSSEANWINDAGDVVGISDTPFFCPGPGAPQIRHGFLWRSGVKTDLGTPVGITNSEGLVINSKKQIVGDSFTCDFSVVDAFIWEKGSITDLNTLIPAGSTLHLFLPSYINERGEIAGLGVLPNGDIHAFLLIPCTEGTDGCENEATAAITTTRRRDSTLTAAQSLAIRRMMAGSRTRFARRYPRLGVPRD